MRHLTNATILIVAALWLPACGKVESSVDSGAATADARINQNSDAAQIDAAQPAITSFVFRVADNAGLTADVTATINGFDISATLPTGDIRNLVPTITYVGSSLSPASGVATDFTNPVIYSVNGAIGYTATIRLDVSGFWWATGTNVYRARADGSNTTTVVPGLEFAAGVAVDTVNYALYYSDYDAGIIYRANLDGSGAAPFLTMLMSPSGLAIDQATSKLYYTEFGGSRISRVNLDGTNIQPVATGMQSPINVALDVANNRLFFITYNSTFVGVANLSLGGYTSLATPGGQGISVVVDVTGGKLYYSTRGSTVRRMNLDGSNNADFITGETGVHGVAIDIPGNKLYWVTTTMIRSATLADGSNKQNVAPSNGTYVPAFIFMP